MILASDDVIASDLEIAFTEAAIEANRKSTQRLKPIQKCYNCEEPVEGDKLFCDPIEGESISACHEDWSFRIKRIHGYVSFEGAK